MGAETRASFGALLKSYRLRAGLTQEALAERARVSVRGIQNLERGGNRPLADMLARLTTVLGLDGPERDRFLFEAATAPRRHGGAAVRPVRWLSPGPARCPRPHPVGGPHARGRRIGRPAAPR